MPSRMIDRIGDRFGRLMIVRCAEHSGKRQKPPKWECKCDCGNVIISTYARLKNGHTRSCGCLRIDQLAQRTTKHGSSKGRLYQIWQDMKKRCCNPKRLGWEDYGGRGITLCDEWNSYLPFHLWAMGHGYQDNLFLDRKDVNGNYIPENCRFVDRKTQNNNKRNHILITFQGRTQNLQQWADELRIPRETLVTRFKKNRWSAEKALTFPKMKNQFK